MRNKLQSKARMILCQMVYVLFINTAIKPEIVESLEKHRDDELTERREKRKKSEEKSKQGDSTVTGSEQKMEVSVCNTNQFPDRPTDVSSIPLPGETTVTTTAATMVASGLSK